MTVTDCWKAYTYALPEKRGNVTLREFADRMAYDLINNMYSSDLKNNRSLVDLVVEVDAEVDPQEVLSPLTVSSFDSIVDAHAFVKNEEMMEVKPGENPRPKRRICSEPGCNKYRHFLCGNYKCRFRKYTVGNEVLYGWFYCQDHWISHWKDVASGKAG